jgi:hypothetical protein
LSGFLADFVDSLTVRQGLLALATMELKQMNRQGTFWTTLLVVVGMNTGVATAQQLVTNNNTSGAGSFSQAITNANGSPGSTITFTLNGETINQTVALPTVTAPVTINGAAGNTILGVGIAPTLNVDFASGSGAFTDNSLALTGSVGTSAIGTDDNGTSGTTGTPGGMAGNGSTATAGGCKGRLKT